MKMECHDRCEEKYKVYTYGKMYMKIEYLPTVIKDVRRDIQCTCTVECA